MNRATTTVAAGLIALMTTSVPALAQYGPGPEETSTSTSTTVRSLEANVANVEPEEALRGTEVTFISDGGLPPGATGPVTLVRAEQGATGTALGTATVGPDGTIEFSFTVPEVEVGIYFVVVEVAGERIIAVLVVVGPTSAALVAGMGSGQTGAGLRATPLEPADVPGEAVAVSAEVRALQPTAAVAAALFEAVTEQGAVLEVVDGQLRASAAPDAVDTDDGSAAGVAPALAAAAAGGLAVIGLAARRLRRSRAA